MTIVMKSKGDTEMTVKFYVYGLQKLMTATKKYITKWQEHLNANLTSEQWTCVEAVLSAVNAALICLQNWTPPS